MRTRHVEDLALIVAAAVAAVLGWLHHKVTNIGITRETETVGPDVYRQAHSSQAPLICQNRHCGEPFAEGDAMIMIDEGMYTHDYC